jgi:hypothetical protein
VLETSLRVYLETVLPDIATPKTEMAETCKNPWLDLPSEPPYVLPCDRENLGQLIQEIKAKDAINLLSLPEPFIGNSASATVLLLSLNPGDSPDDKKVHADPAFREALLCNLRHGPQEYPFYPLNPKLKGTPSDNYWTSHVHSLLQHPDLNRQRIAERLCVVEWFPYHSKKSGVPRTPLLPSQQYSFDLVRRAIGRKLIVGMRAKSRWEKVDARLADVPYLKKTQSPYISPNNCGNELFAKIVEALKSSSPGKR